MSTRPPIPPPDDGEDWYYRLGVGCGLILFGLVIIAMILGIIWLSKQVF